MGGCEECVVRDMACCRCWFGRMTWGSVLTAAVGLLASAAAINRPVYKIALTQKGFAQFIQYDLETPPIREFTFCTWLRVYDFKNEQSIFTYVVNGNNRVLRLWLDSGGLHVKVSFSERASSTIPVDIGKDVWRHICLSYQSDFGAWALYIDSRLASCEVAQNLHGYVLPPGGSLIIGYGTTETGAPSGLEGEIFGANMILASTIEKNHTMKNHPQYTQKSFQRNKIRGHKEMDYVVLKDLQTDEIHNVAKQTPLPKKTNSFIKIQTPHSLTASDDGIQMTTTKPKSADISNESEIFDIVMDHKPHETGNKDMASLWGFVNEAGNVGRFKSTHTPRREQSNSETRDNLMLSEFETPPQPNSFRNDYLEKNSEIDKPSISESIYKLNKEPMKSMYKVPYRHEISEVEVPPPPKKDTNVYGQWTSSKYAGSVLNYLKSINFHNKEKKVPTTIPLTKVSDSYPYASDLKVSVVRPPTNLQKKNLNTDKRFHTQYIQPSSLKRLHMEKRAISLPEINVKILEDDIRSEIQRLHAQTHPVDIKITNRGAPEHQGKSINTDKILYGFRIPRNNDFNDIYKPDNLATSSNTNSQHSLEIIKSNSLFNGLPFLKSVEYFTGDIEDVDSNKVSNSNDMYTKSFSNRNKWHNIKSYNNDYTPRRTPNNDDRSDMDQKIAEANKRHPSIRLKYKPENNRVIPNNDDETIIKGRKLALDVSNQSNHNKDAVSIIKYNHGYLPGHKKTPDLINKIKQHDTYNTNDFDKQVKIGNALNERHVLGNSEEQKKLSFIGGDEKIPDIQRYRSDIDNEKENVPPSLKPNICKNVELYDKILYIHPDGSIDMTHILSPLKIRNVGIEFLVQNYQKCSLDDSSILKSYFLLIHWNTTPVRLFGGAVPKKTKDLCGFF